MRFNLIFFLFLPLPACHAARPLTETISCTYCLYGLVDQEKKKKKKKEEEVWHGSEPLIGRSV